MVAYSIAIIGRLTFTSRRCANSAEIILLRFQIEDK